MRCRAWLDRTDEGVRSRMGIAASLCTSLIGCVAWRLLSSGRGCACIFDNSYGAIGVDEDLVGDAANVGLGDLVDAIGGVEQFAPVAVARLVGSEFGGEAFVIGEAANQVGLGARLDHLQFVVGDVFFFQAIDFNVDG